MTEPRHHPDDALLQAHAAGRLPEAFDLVIATHLSLCDSCRATVIYHEFIGGALLESQTAPIAPDLLDRTLTRAELQQAPDPRDPAPASSSGAADRDVPQPLRDYIGADLEQLRWRPVGLGVSQAVVAGKPPAVARLLRIPPGTSLPDHGHAGRELTLVLRGAFRDSNDRFGPGDLEMADTSVTHTPVADDAMPCICLAATDAPLRFNSLLPRLAQRFIGI